jgi:hypothetical protein
LHDVIFRIALSDKPPHKTPHWMLQTAPHLLERSVITSLSLPE